MYLLYIDESGTKDLHRGEINKEGNSSYFVMGAILIKAEDLSKLENHIQSIKDTYLKDNYAELKSTVRDKHLKEAGTRQRFKDDIYKAISQSLSLLRSAS